MYAAKRPLTRPVIIFLIVASIVLAACGTEIANQTWPGVVSEDDVVYIAYGQGVIAVDVTERQRLWTFPETENAGLTFYAPPSIGDQRIVLGDFGVSGGVFSPGATVSIYALNRDDSSSGALPQMAWTRDDIARDKIVASPTQTDSQVFVGTSDNRLLALDADTGDLQWEFETRHSVWAKPLYLEGIVYIASLDSVVYALEAETGEVMWRTQLGGSVGSAPVLSNDLLYVSSFDRALHALNPASGEEVWTAEAESWVWGSAAVGDSSVFYADIEGNVYAVDALTGDPVWQSSEVEGAIQSSLLQVDGVLFVGSGDVEGDEEIRDGQLTALDQETGEVLWQQQTPGPAFSDPVQVGDSVAVVVSDDGALTLLVYDMESGAPVWDFVLPASE